MTPPDDTYDGLAEEILLRAEALDDPEPEFIDGLERIWKAIKARWQEAIDEQGRELEP